MVTSLTCVVTAVTQSRNRGTTTDSGLSPRRVVVLILVTKNVIITVTFTLSLMCTVPVGEMCRDVAGRGGLSSRSHRKSEEGAHRH